MLVGILWPPKAIFFFVSFVYCVQDSVGICPLLTQWTKMVLLVTRVKELETSFCSCSII